MLGTDREQLLRFHADIVQLEETTCRLLALDAGKEVDALAESAGKLLSDMQREVAAML